MSCHSVFKTIEELIPTLQGWSEVPKVQRMAALVLSIQPEVSVEIGVYAGRSFFGLALAHKFLGKGTAIGIDPWDNDAATEGYTGENKDFWRTNPLDKIHSSFMDELFQQSCLNVSKIIRKKSDDVEPPQNVGVISLDGQHTEQAVRDVLRYCPNVIPGGFAVVDDISWSNGNDHPVQRSVVELRKLGFKELYPLGTGAVFQRQ